MNNFIFFSLKNINYETLDLKLKEPRQLLIILQLKKYLQL